MIIRKESLHLYIQTLKKHKMKNEMYYLESVNKFLIFETCELVSINENTRMIDFNDIQSIDDMDDSWFSLLNDEDFGTIDNAINNRI